MESCCPLFQLRDSLLSFWWALEFFHMSGIPINVINHTSPRKSQQYAEVCIAQSLPVLRLFCLLDSRSSSLCSLTHVISLALLNTAPFKPLSILSTLGGCIGKVFKHRFPVQVFYSESLEKCRYSASEHIASNWFSLSLTLDNLNIPFTVSRLLNSEHHSYNPEYPI